MFFLSFCTQAVHFYFRGISRNSDVVTWVPQRLIKCCWQIFAVEVNRKNVKYAVVPLPHSAEHSPNVKTSSKFLKNSSTWELQ